MSTYPPAPLRWQNKLALDNTHSQITYVGYEGSTFHISGPFAPVPGAQSGIVLKNISHLDPPFKHLDNKGARQDGITWYDSLYDPAEIDMVVEVSGTSANATRKVIRDWFGAWDPKQQGKLCWFSPDRGEWWAPVRMNKPVSDIFKTDWYTSGGTTLTWNCRNDQAFWQSVDSVSKLGARDAVQTVVLSGNITGGFFTLVFNGVESDQIFKTTTAAELQTILGSMSTIGASNVRVTGAPGSWTVTFVGSLGATFQNAFTYVSSLTGSPTIHITQEVTGGGQSGYIYLTNIGDQPGWPRYLCYGPGTFSIADAITGNHITFGPLSSGQIALLNSDPRLPAVVDCSVGSGTVAGQGTTVHTLLQNIISFVTNNNVPPLLQHFESLFGILPPQGPMYSLLKGRFTTAIPPMLEQTGPVQSHMSCSISGGNTSSKIVGALTPMRRWPE